MELFKEILLEGLKSEKIELSFPCVNIDVEKIVHDKAYEMLLKIKEILENDKIIRYFTTIFTSLSGTTISFTISLPAIISFIFSMFLADSTTWSFGVPTSIIILSRTFPFICTTISTVFSFVFSSS